MSVSRLDSPRLQAAMLLTLISFTSFFLAVSSSAEEPVFAKANSGPITFESVKDAAATDLWRALATAHDFDVIFSPQLRDLSLELQIHDATLGEVLDRLALTASQFWIPLDERTILVADDTPQSRREYQPQTVQTIRLQNIRVGNAMTALRSIYGLKHITVDEQRQTMTVRDFASQVKLAEALIANLDVPEDEVTIQLELVSLPEELWQARGESSVEEILQSHDASQILRTDLGIVGQRRARFDMEERDAKSGDRLAVGVQIEARVHPESQEVTLSLDSRLSKVTAESGDLAESKQTTSSWRIASGHSRFVELPGGLAAKGEVLALVMTPKIERVGATGTQKPMWISAAVPMSSSAHGLSEQQRAEIDKRLRERLAQLPRHQADPRKE